MRRIGASEGCEERNDGVLLFPLHGVAEEHVRLRARMPAGIHTLARVPIYFWYLLSFAPIHAQ